MMHRTVRSPSVAPLSGALKTWSRTWKEQRALGALIDAELQFESLLDLLPGAACETPAIASIDPGRDSLSFSALFDCVAARDRLDALGFKAPDRSAIPWDVVLGMRTL